MSMRGFQVPRRIVSDEEGYVYWAQTPSGYLYGPYTNRGIAAGVLTQVKPYSPRTIYDSRTRTYVPNPNYSDNKDWGKVVKAKLGPFEDAPKLSLRDKYNRAVEKLARIEKMLADRGIDIEVV